MRSSPLNDDLPAVAEEADVLVVALRPPLPLPPVV
jgi:hypothetical protein